MSGPREAKFDSRARAIRCCMKLQEAHQESRQVTLQAQWDRLCALFTSLEMIELRIVTLFAQVSVPNRRWPSGDAVIGDRFCHGNVMNWWEEGRCHDVSFNPTTLSSAARQRLLTADSCVAFGKNYLRCQFEFRGPWSQKRWWHHIPFQSYILWLSCQANIY